MCFFYYAVVILVQTLLSLALFFRFHHYMILYINPYLPSYLLLCRIIEIDPSEVEFCLSASLHCGFTRVCQTMAYILRNMYIPSRCENAIISMQLLPQSSIWGSCCITLLLGCNQSIMALWFGSPIFLIIRLIRDKKWKSVLYSSFTIMMVLGWWNIFVICGDSFSALYLKDIKNSIQIMTLL